MSETMGIVGGVPWNKYLSLTDAKRLIKKTEKICGFLNRRGWECSYVTLTKEGQLEWFQYSTPEYCESAHYLSSGHYSWSGKHRLIWYYDDKRERGVVEFPDGREADRWADYTALLVLPTTYSYHPMKKEYAHVWNGESPRLWWIRTRADHKLFERTKGSRHARYFIHSRPRIDGEQKNLGVPAAFEEMVRRDIEQMMAECEV